MKSKISLLNISLGLLLAAGPYTLFKGCESSEKVMRCMKSCKAVMIIGIVIILAVALDNLRHLGRKTKR